MFAALVAGLCYLGLDLAGRTLLERYLTSEDFVQRQDQRYLDDLRSYIQAVSGAAWAAAKLPRWVYTN